MSYIGAEPIVSATRTITEVTATAGQTVFTANGGYTVGYIDVFLNGAQLQTVDFTATNGTTITLTEAAQVGDVVRLVAWGTFSTATHVPLTGDSNITGNLNVSGNLGVGTTSPTAQLQINKSGTSDYTAFRLSNSGASGRTYEIGLGGNTAAAGYANNLYFYDSTAGAIRMAIDSAGRVTTPSQPYCLVTPPANFSVSANTEVLVSGTWGASTNTGNNFNTSGGIFTAPIAGVYQIEWTAFFNASSANRIDVFIYVNGSIIARKEQQKWATNSNNNSSQITATLPLAANDQVRFGVYCNASTTLFSSGLPWQYASVTLLG